MALNAVTIAAIIAACWAHPQGQAYLAKIDQIEALSIACGNPCCQTEEQKGGSKFITIADQLWREAIEAARRQANEAATGRIEIQEAGLSAYAPGYWPEPSQAKINEMFQAKMDALKAAQPIIAARVAEYLAKEEEEAIIAIMLWMDD